MSLLTFLIIAFARLKQRLSINFLLVEVNVTDRIASNEDLVPARSEEVLVLGSDTFRFSQLEVHLVVQVLEVPSNL